MTWRGVSNYKSSLTFFLDRLELSHLRLIRFPFRRLLRLAGITVEVFLPASTRGRHGINAHRTHTNIHASSGIRTHDLSVGAGEDPDWIGDKTVAKWLVYSTDTSKECLRKTTQSPGEDFSTEICTHCQCRHCVETSGCFPPLSLSSSGRSCTIEWRPRKGLDVVAKRGSRSPTSCDLQAHPFSNCSHGSYVFLYTVSEFLNIIRLPVFIRNKLRRLD
jgi:hypothetical protein